MIFRTTFSDNLAESLAKRLLKEYADNPFGLAKVQIVAPTKRALKIIQDSFRSLNPTGSALLLPQLVSLYELETLNPDIPPALDPMERLLLLAKMCHAKPNILTYDKALQLAESLTELLDLAYQFDLDLSHLESLVPMERFAAHWQETVEFLNIISQYWPQILAERHQIDPTDRKIRLIRAFTQHLSTTNTHYVFAGLDSTLPAVQELLVTAAKNDNNWIILDEMITDKVDNSVIKSIQNLYQKLNKPTLLALNPIQTKQEPVGIQALTQDIWQSQPQSADLLQNIHLIVADTPQSEALTIALLLRQTLETPKKTAALITTDRSLARQVITQMQRWHIQLDDSAGTPLNHTPIGIFLQLLTDFAICPDGQHAVALLLSPLVADQQDPTVLRQRVKQAEYEIRKKKGKWAFALRTDLSPWISLFKNNSLTPFATILGLHIQVAEQLATSHDRDGKERLWATEAGQAALEVLTKLMTFADIVGEIEPATYPKLLDMLMRQVAIRPKYGMHPRLDILGPIEARLYHPDVCILGGLNEGTFPPTPETGPWLNRTMRKKLGLPTPEQKIDELALDFLHCFCAPEVYLTRSQKANGAPTIPSRFIEKLKAVADINHIQLTEHQAHLAELTDTPVQFQKITRPAPIPPVEVRPKRLSVTRIELWRRNPYAIYAKYILKLSFLPPLEESIKSSVFGILIHKILETFFKQYPKSTELQDLLHIGKQLFESADLTLGDKIFCWPKFEKMAHFIIEAQKKVVPLIESILSEKEGEMELDVEGKPFTLSGTADCIQLRKDGSIGIIDFKTQAAMPKSMKEVLAGYAPQLPLEALLAQNDGFGTGQRLVSDLSYWSLTGKEDGGKIVSIQKTAEELAQIIAQAQTGIIELIRTFNDPKTPYEVCPIPAQAPTYDDYEHLSRFKEWGTLSEEDA